MSLFVSVCLLVLVAVTAHARTLSEIRRYGLMQVPDDFMKTLIHDPSDGAAPEKMTYSSWGKFMRLTDYQRPSPQSPPPPESSDSPDQSTKKNTSPCLGDRLCTSSLSDNYIIRSMVDYKNDPSSPPPPPSSSQPPITVAKPSASPPLPPSSSQPPITVAKPSASPPPSPSSSSSPIMVAKASASPPPPPESSKSPINIPYNSLQIPTRASS